MSSDQIWHMPLGDPELAWLFSPGIKYTVLWFITTAVELMNYSIGRPAMGNQWSSCVSYTSHDCVALNKAVYPPRVSMKRPRIRHRGAL